MRLSFLGPEGTFSEEAARFFLQSSLPQIQFVPYQLISDVFAAAVNDEVDWAVIPIENTIDGSVSLHLDLLVHEFNMPILTEWIYPAKQNLIGTDRETPINYEEIKTVISHPVVIGQCRQFIKQHLSHAEIETVSSTAKGVTKVKAINAPHTIAIGTKLAAKKYGLALLDENIQEHEKNFTRFMIVGKKPLPTLQGQKHKTSLLIILPEDYAGALHQVLSAFAWRKINLCKIESRPTKKKLGNYYFFIDIEENIQYILVQEAIKEIEALGIQVRILGSYPSYGYEAASLEG
ncbi:prephenate dehydratase [Longirhabdus pacifica]|uniref:prephenate dehydratase n=1 Tax=Longirhabdus pacifica TaxID=2305227 RepID=UPI001008ECE5|nr:prephenate dehydratase [Longirhabdus pacifica]